MAELFLKAKIYVIKITYWWGSILYVPIVLIDQTFLRYSFEDFYYLISWCKGIDNRWINLQFLSNCLYRSFHHKLLLSDIDLILMEFFLEPYGRIATNFSRNHTGVILSTILYFILLATCFRPRCEFVKRSRNQSLMTHRVRKTRD